VTKRGKTRCASRRVRTMSHLINRGPRQGSPGEGSTYSRPYPAGWFQQPVAWLCGRKGAMHMNAQIVGDSRYSMAPFITPSTFGYIHLGADVSAGSGPGSDRAPRGEEAQAGEPGEGTRTSARASRQRREGHRFRRGRHTPAGAAPPLSVAGGPFKAATCPLVVGGRERQNPLALVVIRWMDAEPKSAFAPPLRLHAARQPVEDGTGLATTSTQSPTQSAPATGLECTGKTRGCGNTHRCRRNEASEVAREISWPERVAPVARSRTRTGRPVVRVTGRRVRR
jgi:hypothetical protein